MKAQFKKLFLIINNSSQDEALFIFQYIEMPFCDKEIYFVAFLLKDSPQNQIK